MTARMAPTTPDTAPEATRPLLEQLERKLGKVPNLLATIGHSPAALKGILALGDALAHGQLSRKEVEKINLHVSELNGCAYCISAHTMLGKKAGLSPDEMTAARAGQGSTSREGALLALVRRTLRTGGWGAGAELAAAREAGLTDGEIIEALAVAAERSFTNLVGILTQTEIDFPAAPRLPEP